MSHINVFKCALKRANEQARRQTVHIAMALNKPVTLLGIALVMLTAVPAMAANFDPTGPRVEWLGRIIAIYREDTDTCFELNGPYDAYGTMQAGATGQFKTCAFGYFDPAKFAPGRWLKIIGTLQMNAQRTGSPLVLGAKLVPTSRPLPSPPPYWHDP